MPRFARLTLTSAAVAFVSIGVVAPAVAAPVETPSTQSQSEAYYKNCTAARQAGVAPLHRGDPGYRSALDRDDDGIACE
ncbi:excalibur calcium-binding domain-containing protein [Skermania sp. ID1734]|uniref:excalibur calcium-binding domain-containing protein n=1 Tax=Skermania sp. ID1734 TaxID=2597516 RepID=UPI00351BE5BB